MKADGPVCTVRPRPAGGYLDESGALAVPLKFDDAQPFVEGLAAMNTGARVEYAVREVWQAW